MSKGQSKFSNIELLRADILEMFPTRNGFTPIQQSALSLFNNGNRAAALILTPKSTLRVMLLASLIDKHGHITDYGTKMIRSWAQPVRPLPKGSIK